METVRKITIAEAQERLQLKLLAAEAAIAFGGLFIEVRPVIGARHRSAFDLPYSPKQDKPRVSEQLGKHFRPATFLDRSKAGGRTSMNDNLNHGRHNGRDSRKND